MDRAYLLYVPVVLLTAYYGHDLIRLAVKGLLAFGYATGIAS